MNPLLAQKIADGVGLEWEEIVGEDEGYEEVMVKVKGSRAGVAAYLSSPPGCSRSSHAHNASAETYARPQPLDPFVPPAFDYPLSGTVAYIYRARLSIPSLHLIIVDARIHDHSNRPSQIPRTTCGATWTKQIAAEYHRSRRFLVILDGNVGIQTPTSLEALSAQNTAKCVLVKSFRRRACYSYAVFGQRYCGSQALPSHQSRGGSSQTSTKPSVTVVSDIFMQRRVFDIYRLFLLLRRDICYYRCARQSSINIVGLRRIECIELLLSHVSLISFPSMCGEQYFVARILDLWAMTVVYGLYVALFGGSIYVLLYRRPNMYHLVTSVALFLFTTGYVGVTLAAILDEPLAVSSSTYRNHTLESCNLDSPEKVYAELSNAYIIGVAQAAMSAFLADGVLIYRFVVLWPQRRWVAFPLGALLLAPAAASLALLYKVVQIYLLIHSRSMTTVSLQYLQVGVSRLNIAYNFLQLAYTTTTTGLIASRIWLLVRQLEKVLGKGAGARYRTAVSILVESGSLLFVSQLVLICVLYELPDGPIYEVIFIDVTQILTVIAPTLIIVRVGAGKGFDSVVETAHLHHGSQGIQDTQVRSIRFAEHRTATTDLSHLASLGGAAQDTASESDADISSGSGRSDVFEQERGRKGEKVEVDLNVV
ncbi:hypothetical protein EVG20_g8683 [Dentipellis fragilis]|uniref:Uncharacterized protein n=1 Tax=Dentipellis fragilis TaxID=205917 RepID=A0A4Y9Y3M4_9AGAM|nr:hypothetical protein EVG20_g8683 [Dentipellis fragilis]